MAEIKRTALFSKLSPGTYRALEAAVVACKQRGNPHVELAHWVDQLLRDSHLDLPLIAKAFEIQPERLAYDSTAAIEALPRGSSTISSFSPTVFAALEQAFLWSSVYFNASRIRSGHLIIALQKSAELRPMVARISKELAKIDADRLAEQFQTITTGSPEAVPTVESSGAGATPGEASGAIPPAELGRQEALKRFTTNLTEKARKGEIDPIVGRDAEIRQCVDILMRRRQNNPILTGEAGVGKTAVAEGFALRIVAGDVPPSLRNVSLLSLDIGLLQAGASMKGEFEQRLRSVIDEVQESAEPIILFIDEVHTLIGAGGAAGTGDAANLLKPALARGALRTVAATTWDEYKRHIEKDPALTRRFQTVKIDEPSEQRAILMMRGIAGMLEKHHKVQILDEAIEAAVQLSTRYIPARQLPDKSASLLDTACARVAGSQHAVPAKIDDLRRRIQAMEAEKAIVGREQSIGIDHAKRQQELETTLADDRTRLVELEKHWNAEKELVVKVLDLRDKLRADGKPVDAVKDAPTTSATEANGPNSLLGELQSLQKQLADLQGESPLIFSSVDRAAVAAVVADWTGIPMGRMVKNEIEHVLNLANHLEKRVIGQRHALDIIARRVQTSRARLDNPTKPVGVFMLVGPSGTGKTETALTLAAAIYGGEGSMIALNMTEYTEAHGVSKIKGAPPGYVGHEDGGILTNFVQRRPYCLVLLDEFEKAHPDIHRLFMQVFDKGELEDGRGRNTDFRNTIVILTSNAAQEVIVNLCKDPELMPNAEGLERAMRGPLTKVFPDALLNRLVVVPYYPISREMLQSIIRMQLARVGDRILRNHKVPFSYTEAVAELISQRCAELERGARMVDAVITNGILPEIGRQLLQAVADAKAINRVHIDAQNNGFQYLFE